MNQKSRITMGPGAASLTLIFVMVSISVLAMLSLMSSRNDLKLSERSVEVVEEVYALNEEAEQGLAEIDEILIECAEKADSEEIYLDNIQKELPERYVLEGRDISWTVTDGERTLELAAEVQPLESESRVRWTRHMLRVGEEESEW
ncbi:MAG: hypothetical protein IJ899_18125 [Blautia sp.]|nr:hypothetical protein [Blautia sp.]